MENDIELDQQTRHPVRFDFVLIETNPPNPDRHTGVVQNVVFDDEGDPLCYSVQLWDDDGPQNVVMYFDPNEVAIHPQGRLNVMDNSSKHTFKRR